MSFSFLNKKTYPFFCILCLIVVLCFISFRGEYVGNDTHSYVLFYEDSSFYYNGDKTDLGFEFIGRFLHVLCADKCFFIFVSGILSFGGFAFLLYKTSPHIIISLFLFTIMGTSFHCYFFPMYLSAIRQTISLSFLFFAMFFLFQKKEVIYSVPFFGVSFLIHGSSFIALPFTFLAYKKDFSKKYLVYFIFISYLIGGSRIVSIPDLLKNIFSIFGFNDGHYSEYSEVSFGNIEDGFFNSRMLPFSLLGIFFLYVVDKKHLNVWFVKVFFISICLNNFFSDNEMWSRLILCFSLFSVISIPYLLNFCSLKIKILVYLLIFSYYLRISILYMQYNLICQEGNVIVPYTTWFN